MSLIILTRSPVRSRPLAPLRATRNFGLTSTISDSVSRASAREANDSSPRPQAMRLEPKCEDFVGAEYLPPATAGGREKHTQKNLLDDENCHNITEYQMEGLSVKRALVILARSGINVAKHLPAFFIWYGRRVGHHLLFCVFRNTSLRPPFNAYLACLT